MQDAGLALNLLVILSQFSVNYILNVPSLLTKTTPMLSHFALFFFNSLGSSSFLPCLMNLEFRC